MSGSNFDGDFLDRMEKRDNRIKNFSTFNSSYITASEVVYENEILSTPIIIKSAYNMNINDVLSLLESQFNVSYFITDVDDLEKEQIDKFNVARSIKYEGDLKGFVDYISNVFGVSSKVGRDGILHVSYYDVRTFNLDQFIDSNKSTASLTVGGKDGTASGLSASSESSIESNTWEKIEEYLADIIGENGSFTILEDFSMVQIKARPHIMKEVDMLFNELKKESEMQVAIQYRVITINESKLRGIAAGLGVSHTGSNYTITSEIIDMIPSLTSGGTSFVSATSDISARLDAVVEAIGQEVISEGQFVGLPNRVMPINLTTKQSYVSEIEKINNSNNDETSTAVKTAEITTGISMLVIPKVLDNGRIQVTAGYTRKLLVDIDNHSGVQLPIIDENETLSTVIIDSGSLELVSLFKNETNGKRDGISLFSGGTSKDKKQSTIAVIIGVDSYKLSSTLSKRK
ncbi:pilus assembly protein [Photobacterium kishitanii]|uniref:Pilus assembly protein n=2 Tax=Photobacterium kishitanii TaxID=318456 RepID=A0AAX0YWX9_9GAMM|nr:pilus assembly protein [Photobacterium kishitanii]PSX30459.1 pilus assembly protein [Photobacterium kishitanii]PSX35889.1 pilus assembly protein [Photobacterium kishitanii]PSX45524.1 pilus assembly protein [Photobacterium kishitanii]